MKKHGFAWLLCLISVQGFSQINLDKIEQGINTIEKNIPSSTTTNTNTTNGTSTTTGTNTTTGANNTTNTTGTTTTNTSTTTTTGTSPLNLSSLTEGDMASGLKEALTQGATKASAALNATDGFYKNPKVKIPIPEEASKLATELRKLGYGKKVDEFELTLNRAAESAAKEASPIFKSAITNMTIKDAKSILTGSDTAATHYLRNSTYKSLFKTFSPHIKKAIDNNAVSKQWTELTTLYNKLPTTKTKVNTDLVSYTTHKALKGVFLMVASEEKKIRKDPVARTTDIMKKVFGGL